MKHRRRFSLADILVVVALLITFVVIIYTIYRVSTRQYFNMHDLLSVDDTSTTSIVDVIETSFTTAESDTYQDEEDEYADDNVVLINLSAANLLMRQPYYDVPEHIYVTVENEEAFTDEDKYECPIVEEVSKRYVSIDAVDIIFTQEGIGMLASLVTLEVGAESYECQQAVASVVINRMIIENKSLHEVVYQENLFSVAPYVEHTEPFDQCVDAVLDVIQNGTTIPRYVTYFRADCYHDWGDRYVSWRRIDKTYFTYDKKLKAIWE